jgi:thiosulfate/3-mercaptopyruvate sulfurtransferase
MSRPVLTTVAELRDLLDSDRPPAVLDVRWALGDPHGRDHYADGHIPGAVYVDLDTELAAPPSPQQGRHPLPGLDTLQAAVRRWGVRKGRPVVVHDDLGNTAAARAWWLLRYAGLTDVTLETGIPAAPAPGDVVLRAGALPVTDADGAAELAAGGLLLDARAGERYRGEAEPVDPRAGHIPGAVSAPTGENLAADGTFLPADALRERFETAGADAGTRIGVYCGSGVTAAHQIAALEIAVFETAVLFPGSWSAWSADPDRPAATGPLPSGPLPSGSLPSGSPAAVRGSS